MNGVSPEFARVVAAFVVLAALVAALVWGWTSLGGRAALRRVIDAAWRRAAGLRVVRASRSRHRGAWAFLARRVAPAGVFGLHFTLGLAVSALALGAFAKVAEGVLERDDLARVDAAIASAVAAHRTPAEARVCRAVSAVGAPEVVTAVGAGVAAVLLLRRRWFLAGAWVATLAGGGLLDQVLKALFRRRRPAGAEAFLEGPSWSFPSAHAMGAAVCYGMLAFLLVRRVGSAGARAGVVATAALVALLVGGSRVCLGVHYASDVVGAFAAAAMWLAACASGVGAVERRARAVDRHHHATPAPPSATKSTGAPS